MSTHNICFYGEIRKIIPELSPNTPSCQFLWSNHCTNATGNFITNCTDHLYILRNGKPLKIMKIVDETKKNKKNSRIDLIESSHEQ